MRTIRHHYIASGTRDGRERACATLVRELIRNDVATCVFADDRMAMDLVMELVREAARDANVDAFAPHDDMATFARERDYNDWLARSYGDDRATPMLVTTDAFSSPTPARTRCLVHFDFPRDASQYRARMAGAFSCDDDDACGGELHVISLVVGAGEAARLRSTADALRCRVDEFDIETLAEIRTARAP